MTSSEVTVQTRLQRPFIGVSGTVTIPTIPAFYAHLETLSTWIARDGLSCSGPPFLNYHRINMQNTMDVTLGFFVENIDSAAGMGEQVDGGTKVAGVLPGGLFACMDYVGHPRNLIRAHAEIQEWESNQPNINFDVTDSPDGEIWGCRLEISVTDPKEEPDMEKWTTRIEYLLRD